MHEIQVITDDFWNLRGSFHLGPLDIGTHASLVRLRDGSFVMLDAYSLTGDVEREVLAHTDGGRAVRAVIHLHPFHTLHVGPMAKMFPDAKQYGTSRHKVQAPDVRWEALETNQPVFAELFADDFVFSVPEGVAFIADDPRLHFSSVLAIHPASRTLHVDDTLLYNPLPFIGGLNFHPTLAKVLEPRPGASDDFRHWARGLADACEGLQHVAVAHARPFPDSALQEMSLSERIRKALDKAERTLARHDKAHPA